MAQKLFVLIKEADPNLLIKLKDRLINIGFNRDCFSFFDDEDSESESICIDVENFEVYQIPDATKKKYHYDLDNDYDLDIIIEEIENNI